MRFGVLGPLTVWTDDGRPVTVPGRKVRVLLADLLVHDGRPVMADRLIDDIWGADPPRSAPATLAAKVSLLRRALEDAEPGGRELVVSGPGGYALRVASDSVDAHRFLTLTAAARAAEPRAAAALLAEALGLWRGPAFADVADAPFATAAIAHLAEQRLVAYEERAELRLGLGEHAALVGELTALVAEHPLRERLRGCLLRALHGAGRQREALQSYQDLRARLADELGLDPSPALAAIHEAILARDPVLDPPPPLPQTAAGRPGNLPAPRTTLVGRDAAIADVLARLTADRLVTLSGSGGVGKTRLALACAARAAPDFADGAWLVELAAAGRPGEPDVLGSLAEAVLTALEVRATAPGDRASALDRLAAVLRPRQLLLVLDNCEHVLDAAAELVDRLLAAASGLRVLVTSREPLALAGEVVWTVPPLEVPAADAPLDPALLQHSAAVELFVARATAAVAGFRLDADTAAAVAVMCRRLDGIPLALELAATRVRTLGVHGVVSRLDDRFRLLATGHRGVPRRQQTLEATIDWSWELLTGPEQTLLRRLAVHADGATPESAGAVAADARLDRADVPDLLARLADRSLVEVVPGEGPRYRLLESVAEYSLRKLRAAGEAAVIRDRHADHYIGLAESAADRLRGPQQVEALRLLDAEAANLRAALATAAGDPQPRRALRLAAALGWYWVLRGRLGEARRALDAALALRGPAPAGLRAVVVAWRARIALLQGDPEGPRLHAAALEALEAIEEPSVRARAEWSLADAGEVADVPGSARLLERALATGRACGDQWVEAAAHLGRARQAHVRGDIRALERDAKRAAELFGLIGEQWGQSQASSWLGALAELTADYERAAALHGEGLRWAEELDLWLEVSFRSSWLGWIAMQVGEHAKAAGYGERALALANEQGFRDGQTFARIVLGYTARQAGRLDDAERHLRTVLDATPDEGRSDPAVHVPMVLCELGFVAELRGAALAAARLHEEAYDLAQKLGAARDTAGTLVGLAGALAAAEAHAAAATVLGAAVAAHSASGMPPAPAARGDIDRITAAARTALGETAFAAALEAGSTLEPDAARVLAERELPA